MPTQKSEPCYAPSLYCREQEMAFLHDEWAKARAGNGRTVVLSGEAGIGKSTLLAHWGSQLAGHDIFRVSLQCSARHRDTPFYPLIGHLRRAAYLSALMAR